MERENITTQPLTSLQEKQKEWDLAVFGGLRVPLNVYLRMMEEVDELRQAIDKEERRPEEILEESADIVILLFFIANAYNQPLEFFVQQKLSKNFEKYNPDKVQELVSQGYSPNEALQVLKEQWNGD
ncbi:MAG: hypothetical protein KatS3mg090_1018 [Patescibacteria group bacterium]|nr:MAG: hypothetical protein KatS3mg090_1018 [Patescibacteria group bacterium]